MPLPRIFTGSLFLAAIGCAGIFGAEKQPPKNFDVVPIPLQYAGEDEEYVPAPPLVIAQAPQKEELPELTAPSKPDPFAQPGFDPFDDEQFRPLRTDPTAPSTMTERPLQLPAETERPAFEVTTGKRETIRERYAKGAVKIEREMLQDTDGNYVLDGSWKWFSEKGQLIADGDYYQDKRQGLWRRSFAAVDAPLFRTAPYNQFQAPFHAEATFAGGVLHGAWTIYDSQQRKVSEIYYEDGKRHGPAMWWQVKGTPAIQSNFDHGEIHGEAYVFDAAGKVIRRDRYDQGWKYARRTEKYANGKPKEISNWLDGHYKLAGEDDFWNARIAAFEVDQQPVRNGQQVTYFPSGQMQRQQEFSRGKPVGEILFWHENGQKALAGRFNENGKPDGEWTWWHANGLRSLEGTYLAGQAQTDWTWWNTDGKITRRGELDVAPDATRPESIATSPGPTTLGRPREVE